MGRNHISDTTPHQDVNHVLILLSDNLEKILGDQLVGLYLTGSLTYGDFDRESSDIDFLAVLTRTLSKDQLEKLKGMHSQIGKSEPTWAKRLEGSYITKSMLASTERPKEPRPYVNGGKVSESRYGNEWILNLHVIYERGITLLGTDVKELFPKINIDIVRQASKKDLHDDWEPKLDDPAPFTRKDYDSSHLQAYAVLTMCRALYRAKNDDVASKRVASGWVKKTYGEPWVDLVEKAENWQHGKLMNADKETLAFIKFTLEKVG